MLEKPARLPCVDMAGRLLALGQQPAQVGMSRHARVGRDPFHGCSNPCPDEPLRREEGHLGVVRNPACAAVGLGITGHPLGTVVPDDRCPVVELDGSPESVSDSPSEKTADESFPDGAVLLMCTCPEWVVCCHEIMISPKLWVWRIARGMAAEHIVVASHLGISVILQPASDRFNYRPLVREPVAPFLGGHDSGDA